MDVNSYIINCEANFQETLFLKITVDFYVLQTMHSALKLNLIHPDQYGSIAQMWSLFCPVSVTPQLNLKMLFSSEQLMELMHARARRRFARGLKRKPMALVKKLRRAKKEAPPNEKPEIVKTHLRNMIIVPEMVGSIVGIYNGKTFNQVGFLLSYYYELACFYVCFFQN